MPGRQPAAVELFLSFDDHDHVYADRQTRLLKRELTAIGVPADIARETRAPTGARGAAEIIGLLQIATLVPLVVPKLIDVLQVWLASRKGATIKIKVGDVEVEVAAGEVETARTLLADVALQAKARATP